MEVFDCKHYMRIDFQNANLLLQFIFDLHFWIILFHLEENSKSLDPKSL